MRLHGWAAALCLMVWGSPLAQAAEPVAKAATATAEKPRVFVLTDIENEPDDAESLVRFLTYANQWDIEGLVATTSIHMRHHTAPERIRQIVRAYGQVQPNLNRHEPGYPSAEHLLSVVSEGPQAYGLTAVGDGLTSPGAEQLIRAVDRRDERPLWVLVWGGPNTLAQALHKVRATRSKAELKRFVSKLRVYTISDQDDSGPWLRQTFPDLFYIASPGMHDGGAYHRATWSGISGDRFHGRFVGADFSLVDVPWLQTHIMSKGPLGAEYPKPIYMMEGDTPSFLYLINNGLGAPEHPNWGSWGGRYEFYTPPPARWHLIPETRPLWTNADDEVLGVDGNWYTDNHATIWRWRQAYQNDFAARMDWTIKSYAEANHPPEPKLSHPDRLSARLGDTLELSAEGSTDPDKDALSFEWFVYGEAGGFTTSSGRNGRMVTIANADQPKINLTIPKNSVFRTGTLHVIVAVTDKGTPALTRYKRVILDVKP